MPDYQNNEMPLWLKLAAGIALVWNLMGLGAFVQQMTMSADALAALPEAERILFTGLPIWLKIAFGAAVIGGTLGCIGLLMKKSWALPVFIVSLIGILFQMYYNIVVINTPELYGPGEGLVMPFIILVIGVLLIWLTKKAILNRWIN